MTAGRPMTAPMTASTSASFAGDEGLRSTLTTASYAGHEGLRSTLTSSGDMRPGTNSSEVHPRNTSAPGPVETRPSSESVWGDQRPSTVGLRPSTAWGAEGPGTGGPRPSTASVSSDQRLSTEMLRPGTTDHNRFRCSTATIPEGGARHDVLVEERPSSVPET